MRPGSLSIQRMRMGVLVVLALSRTRSASRERIMALIWPEHGPDRARHLLREAVYRLREALGEDVLVASGDDLELNASKVTCDVRDFEQAAAREDWAEVDRRYAGPLLEGFFLSGAPEFDRWIGEERARVAEVHGRALEALAQKAAGAR